MISIIPCSVSCVWMLHVWVLFRKFARAAKTLANITQFLPSLNDTLDMYFMYILLLADIFPLFLYFLSFKFT